MIDDEKIKKAIENYIKYSSVEDEYPGTEGNAFKAGANWAINEFPKDLWHPAIEKPILRNGKCLVVYNSGEIDIFKISFVYEMLSNYGKDGMGWKCWAYVLDLFPNEGCNHD